MSIMKTNIALLIVLCMVPFAIAGETAGTREGVRRLDKKLIEYGWDVPFADDVAAHIRTMEKRPFDGVIFKLRGGGKVLTPTPWKEADFARDFASLKRIEWKRFTDNFIIAWAASDQDWFNDHHWDAITQNARLLARGAKLGRCVGICFDAEPYGTNPWSYVASAHRSERTFGEVESMVRHRGDMFMRALESEFPGLTILTFFETSYFTRLMQPMDPAKRAEKLSRKHYALLPAFLNGMLQAATADVRIIDGNERAYYYTDSRSYLDIYQRVTQGGLLMVDPALWDQYRAHLRVGQALYVDQVFGLRKQRVLGHYLTGEERPKWFEHNVYWALKTADRYVWCYSERMNWWTGKGVPPGCEEAIRSARQKIADGRDLGFDLAPIIAAGKQRQEDEVNQRITMRTAEIPHLAQGTARPVVDGRLDDAAWRNIPPLAPFVALASRNETLKGRTEAWVAYDDAALYLAFRCHEPNLDRIQSRGQKRDDPVWEGDDVEILLSTPKRLLPFYHFMVAPNNVAWDGVHQDTTVDTAYNPSWEHAVLTGKDVWQVEVRIPWGALSMQAPKPGTRMRANLCRQRMPVSELSSWSPMAKGFLEVKLFGTWIFR